MKGYCMTCIPFDFNFYSDNTVLEIMIFVCSKHIFNLFLSNFGGLDYT